MIPTIRALPGNAITGHTPEIFEHASLAYGETASALPTEGKILGTTMALLDGFAAFASFASR